MLQNRSIIDEIRVHRLQFGDTHMPLLAVKASLGQDSANDEDNFGSGTALDYIRFSADANGSTGSKLIVFVNVGSSAAAYTQYQFSAYATGVTDPGGIDSSPTHTQCLTLGALVKALRSIPQLDCYRLHGAADLSIDTDDFIDVTSVNIAGNNWTKTLYQDASEVNVFTMRVGNPETFDRGRMKLIRIEGILAGASGGTVKLYEDPDDESADDVVELLSFASAAAQTAYVNNDMLNASVYRGPLLLEVNDSSATDVDMKLSECQSEW